MSMGGKQILDARGKVGKEGGRRGTSEGRVGGRENEGGRGKEGREERDST